MANTRPKDPLHLYAMHDYHPDWAALVKSAGKTGWCVVTLEIGDNPTDLSSLDFTSTADQGLTVIGRLNYSHHGQGTIPLPDRYEAFAARCRNFVAGSQGCWTWIIGNEPNLAIERPGAFIQPEEYARCFTMCRNAIKSVDSSMRVLVAPVAPYNVESGDWIKYWGRMLSAIAEADGLTGHTYSRGPSPASVISQDKMDAPYNMYYNGFMAYKDLLAAVPTAMRSLPFFLTETDQMAPWVDTNSGWVRSVYAEIDAHNRSNGTQKIFCLALYRWSKDDQWMISPKKGVIDDFVQTMKETNYLVPATLVPVPAPELKPPWARVTAPAGANIRTGPGMNYPILTALPNGTLFRVRVRNAESTWWGTDRGWVSGTVIEIAKGTNVPIVSVSLPTIPAPTLNSLGREWIILAMSRTLNIDPLIAKSILAIESGGRAFENNRMIIRFENHIFYGELMEMAPQLKGFFIGHFSFGTPSHTGHKWRLNPGMAWDEQHNGGQTEEWQVFSFARTAHEEAAMRSISMGSAQVMGFNFSTVGYHSVKDMFNDYNTPGIGEYNQLVGFFSYITNREGLLEAVRNKNWDRIAASYNGTGGISTYAPAIHTKYLELGGKD